MRNSRAHVNLKMSSDACAHTPEAGGTHIGTFKNVTPFANQNVYLLAVARKATVHVPKKAVTNTNVGGVLLECDVATRPTVKTKLQTDGHRAPIATAPVDSRYTATRVHATIGGRTDRHVRRRGARTRASGRSVAVDVSVTI